MIDNSFEAFEEQFEQVFRGNWHIVRKLGAGSFSTVYEVRKESMGFVESAAMKHISFPKDESELQAICQELNSDDPAEIRGYVYEKVQGFHDEYQFMQSMRAQTNIVSCQDFSIVEKTDMPGYDIFFFMELLKSVADVSRQQPFDQIEVIRLGIDICKALELLQKNNMLHRDIKPENLYVNANGDYKLGDFGSARLLSGRQMIVTSKGTQAYIAPEIIKLEPAGAYSDIYSLGLVMYRLLNDNRPPFMDAESTKSAVVREKVETERLSGTKLPKPAHGDKDLVAVVLRACEYDPKNRYQTAARMRMELEGILKNKMAAREKEKARENTSRGSRKTGAPESKTNPGFETPEKLQSETRASMKSQTGTGTGTGAMYSTSFKTPEQIKAEKEEEERIAKEEAEKRKKEEQNQTNEDLKKKRKKRIIGWMIALVVVAAGIAAGVLLKQKDDRNKEYEARFISAQNLLKSRATIDEGIQQLEALKETGYKPAEVEEAYQKALKGKEYNAAQDLLDREEYDAAIDAFSELEGYGKADEKVAEAQNAKTISDAGKELDRQNYDQVLAMLEGNQSAAAVKLISEAQAGIANTAAYDEAMGKMTAAETILRRDATDYNGAIAQYRDAQTRFHALGSFSRKDDVPAATREKECTHWIDYLTGKQELALGEGHYEKARNIFKDLAGLPEGAFADAEAMIQEVNRAEKKKAAENAFGRNLDDAEAKYNELRELGDEAGAEAGLTMVANMRKFNEAQALMNQGWTERNEELLGQASMLFSELGGFNGAGEKAAECGYASQYVKAEKMLKDPASYKEAKAAFEKLKKIGFEDAGTRVNDAENLIRQEETYQEALTEMDRKQFNNALQKLKTIKGYRDADARAETCDKHLRYIEANEKITKGSINDAREILEKLQAEGFDAAAGRIADINAYNSAKDLQNTQNYPEALAIYNSLGNFYDAGSRAADCQLNIDYQYWAGMIDTDPDNAKAFFDANSSFRESKNLSRECELRINYRKAMEMKETNPEAAYKTFLSLGSFADSAAQATACKLTMEGNEASSYIKAGNYDAAITVLVNLEDANSQEMLRYCRYMRAKQYQEAGEYPRARELFQLVADYADSGAHIRECDYAIYYQKATNGVNVNPFTDRALRLIFDYNGYADKETWAGYISITPATATEVGAGFARSITALSIPMSHAEIADALFRIMLGHGLTKTATEYIWYLDNGMSILYDLHCIAVSTELADICAGTSLEPGDVELQDARDKDPGLTGFVYRGYKYALDREPNVQELNDWCNAYQTRTDLTISTVIREFLTGSEFSKRQLSNEEYVDILYHVILDRVPDDSQNFAEQINSFALSRPQVLDILLTSHEFDEIRVKYGLH